MGGPNTAGAIFVLLLCAEPSVSVRADEGVVGSSVLVEAQAHYDRGRRLFDSGDFEAAALEFEQAQTQYATAPDDKDAHARRRTALSNEATCYANAHMPVEASDTFRLLRSLYATELPAADLALVDAAIVKLEDEIGTATIAGLPHEGTAVVRIDGHLWQVAGAPIRLAAREHGIDVVVPRFRPFAVRFVVRARQDTPVAVTLQPSTELARLRIETPIAIADVTIDEERPARAPVDRAVAPGRHHYRVTAKNHTPSEGDVDVAPGERLVIRAPLVPAHTPLGFRAEFFGLWIAPLSAGTPASATSGFGVRLFGSREWLGTLRTGVQLEKLDRRWNHFGVGLATEWCPLSWHDAANAYAVCPINVAILVRAPGHEDGYRGSLIGYRLWSGIEWRRNVLFARGSIGIEPDSLTGDFPNDDVVTWEASFDLTMGFEL